MSAHEQEVLEAYEPGKLKRQRLEAVAQRAAPFRTSMPDSRTFGSGASGSTSASAATEALTSLPPPEGRCYRARSLLPAGLSTLASYLLRAA